MEVEVNKIFNGDAKDVLRTLQPNSINCCVTSPPYWGLRDYGVEGQLGLEANPNEYVQNMVDVFREVKRVLSNDGTLWLNLGDSYAGNCSRTSTGRAGMGAERDGIFTRGGDGLKPKDLIGIPWRVAFALQADGWYLRQDIIWHKPNPMPESVSDRCTKSHEYIFLLSKSPKYYFNSDAILEIATGYDGRKDTLLKGSPKYADNNIMPCNKPQTFAQNKHERWRYKNLQEDGQKPNTMHLKRLEGKDYLSPVRNKRSVWEVPTQPCNEAHFAVFPKELIRPCIKAGSPIGGVVLDPFMGSGTTACVCVEEHRNYVGVELNPKYIKIAQKRILQTERTGLIVFEEREEDYD